MKYFKRTSNKHLGELLIERGIITNEQIKIALEYQKKHGGLVGDILVKLKFATERDIAQAITCQYGFPYLPLTNYEIDKDVIGSVPEHLCQQFCVIPIDKIGKSLTLAMSNPLYAQAIEDIELITGCHVQVFVSTTTEINIAIQKYYLKSK